MNMPNGKCASAALLSSAMLCSMGSTDVVTR